jgi:hypothetical protein
VTSRHSSHRPQAPPARDDGQSVPMRVTDWIRTRFDEWLMNRMFGSEPPHLVPPPAQDPNALDFTVPATAREASIRALIFQGQSLLIDLKSGSVPSDYPVWRSEVAGVLGRRAVVRCRQSARAVFRGPNQAASRAQDEPAPIHWAAMRAHDEAAQILWHLRRRLGPLHGPVQRP